MVLGIEKRGLRALFWDFKNIYTDVICNSCDITITSQNTNIIKKRTLLLLLRISSDSIRKIAREGSEREKKKILSTGKAKSPGGIYG